MAPRADTSNNIGIASNSDARAGRPPKKPQKSKQQSPRPTHFLSLPLGHHPELRERIREFHHRLMPPGETTSAIEGFDRSILVDPRRLHFTIGVMTLTSTGDPPQEDAPGTMHAQGKTLSEAIALLHSLGPEIDAITREPVMLSLEKMGVLKTKREQAGVLYVAPNDEITEDTLKVIRIFDLVGQRFRQEGFIEEAARPAVLHCTLINASHRKPRRMPRTFSYREIFERASGQAESAEIPETEIPLAQSQPEGSVAQPSGQDSQPSVQEKSIRADFGTWAVSEIQLCKMGSHGPQNEYISVASVPVGGN